MRRLLTLVAAPSLAVAFAASVPEAVVPVRRSVAVSRAESLSAFVSDAAAARTSAANDDPDRPVTVVVIPGPVGSAFSVRHVLSALASRDMPGVVIDPLGMGTSPRPTRADYSLSRQAQRIEAVLDSLHIQRFMLVAHGTSATNALHVAADQPDRVASVLSLSGGIVERQGTHSVRVALALSFLLDNPIGRTLGRRKFESAMRETSADPAWVTRDVVRSYLEPFDQDMRGSLRTLKAMSESVEPSPTITRLPDVRAPVHVLIGARISGSTPPGADLAQMARGLRRFRVDTIARSGVMLHEERPDAVVDAILTMLRGHVVAQERDRYLVGGGR